MITPNEVENIEDIGELDGSPVQIIQTKGGLYVAAGRPNGKKDPEFLAASSHPAVVKFNVEKQFKGRFRPALNKSETGSEPVVMHHDQYLSSGLANKGYSIYTIQKDLDVTAIVTKFGVEIMRQEALIKAESLELDKTFVKGLQSREAVEGEITKSLLKAVAKHGEAAGKESVELKQFNQTVEIKKILENV